MKVRALLAFILMATLSTTVSADTNIVNETFDSYATQAAFEAVWRPDLGTGYNPTAGPNGLLVPNTGIGITPPNDDPPGVQGQAVAVGVGINEYDDDNNSATEPFELVPTASESVQFSADIFSDTAGNKRISVGLRNDTVQRAFGVFGYNFVELGHYQAATNDPTDPTDPPVFDQPVTSFAYRVALFDSNTLGAPLVREPNWQYFPLDPVLDTVDSAAAPNPDGLVTPTDIGVGWHRYSATITPTEITLELDLFRDGLQNSEATEGVGTPGVDSSVTWSISPTNEDTLDAFDFDPFTSLRIGTPSGIATVNESVIDNVRLDLIDVASFDPADLNQDGFVDGLDLGILLGNWGGSTTPDQGELNGTPPVDGLDLGILLAAWNPPPAAATAAVPEPTSCMLLMTCAALLAGKRRVS